MSMVEVDRLQGVLSKKVEKKKGLEQIMQATGSAEFAIQIGLLNREIKQVELLLEEYGFRNMEGLEKEQQIKAERRANIERLERQT
jgi:hypothetical protein